MNAEAVVAGQAPPPPPPAEINFHGHWGKNPLGGVSFGALCARLPSVLWQTARMAWVIDRRGVLLLMFCQILTGVASGVLLTGTSRAMRPLVGTAPAADRLHAAMPALVVVAVAAAAVRISTALAAYADERITPGLTTEADAALVDSVCKVEAAAYGEDGFTDRQEAAEMGVVRTQMTVQDARTFTAALLRMVAASGVLTVLSPLMLPLLLLAVLPAGVGAVLAARVDYATHYANVGDRNVRSMMRWWATLPKYGDEVRANGMTGYLLFWYRALSARIDRRTLATAPQRLRIALTAAALSGFFLLCTWATLAWLADSGRVGLDVVATAVVAVQTALSALSQLVSSGAAMFHSSLYLADMRSFLDLAAERAPRRGPDTIAGPVDEVRLDDVVYQYPGKERPAVDHLSLTLRRGEIVAIVGENGSGKSTLSRLITGIYLADKGSVTWNGVDLAGADPHSVWARCGLVPQIFAQWPLRARENVTLGQPRTYDDEPVWAAVDAVGMREAIEELPQGLDTLLARELFGGSELSGGQWQRLVCSRALYRRPDLLILDEPTSQMDARGEHRIFEGLKAIAADRITLVVTHQLENTKIADRIIVMDHGRITEQGTFDDLVNANGLFAELLALSKDR
ncbi:ATP-binding cassette, subfamily B [Streptomyces sp. DvalAA-14]|uniref:ATP-binding cassette domain-containing protein n=1 Tax=unclassified Streptomyces TaxID=2593676 RepID=UPI00081AF260|nr:ABC transporter ATP-binding protein [Streptomyces sp. DvalAA-14]MYS23770.1 ATP-binding cassette domain-containing protein [Streptomyces sp. SID4948]SCE38466.1 ATP-binding cassette, subfamily B [Streptomyces sp. DvalAA-14]